MSCARLNLGHPWRICLSRFAFCSAKASTSLVLIYFFGREMLLQRFYFDLLAQTVRVWDLGGRTQGFNRLKIQDALKGCIRFAHRLFPSSPPSKQIRAAHILGLTCPGTSGLKMIQHGLEIWHGGFCNGNIHMLLVKYQSVLWELKWHLFHLCSILIEQFLSEDSICS